MTAKENSRVLLNNAISAINALMLDANTTARLASKLTRFRAMLHTELKALETTLFDGVDADEPNPDGTINAANAANGITD